MNEIKAVRKGIVPILPYGFQLQKAVDSMGIGVLTGRTATIGAQTLGVQISMAFSCRTW